MFSMRHTHANTLGKKTRPSTHHHTKALTLLLKTATKCQQMRVNTHMSHTSEPTKYCIKTQKKHTGWCIGRQV